MDEHARDPVRLHESDESDQKVCTAGPRVPTHDDGTDDDVLELDYSL